jgi:hypothetical protein
MFHNQNYLNSMKEYNAGSKTYRPRIIGGDDGNEGGEEAAAEEAAAEKEKVGDDDEGGGESAQTTASGPSGNVGPGAFSTDKPLQVIDMREQLSGVTNVKWREQGLEVLKTVCYYINNGPDDTCMDTGYSGDQRPTLPSNRIKKSAENNFLQPLFENYAANFVDFITEEQEDEEEEQKGGATGIYGNLNERFMRGVKSVEEDGKKAVTTKLVKELDKSGLLNEDDSKEESPKITPSVKTKQEQKLEPESEEEEEKKQDLKKRAEDVLHILPQVIDSKNATEIQIEEAEQQEKQEEAGIIDVAPPAHPLSALVETENSLNNMSAISILKYWTQKVVEQINCHADSHRQIEDIENTVIKLAHEGISKDIENFKNLVLTPMAEIGRQKVHEERVTPRKNTLVILKDMLEKIDINKDDKGDYDFIVLNYINILGELYPLEKEFVEKEYIIFTSSKDSEKKIKKIIDDNLESFKQTDIKFQKMLGAEIKDLSEINQKKESSFYSNLFGGKKKKKSNKKTKKKKRATKNKTR